VGTSGRADGEGRDNHIIVSGQWDSPRGPCAFVRVFRGRSHCVDALIL